MAEEPITVYLCYGAYWPSKEDADNFTNQIMISEIPEGSTIQWYRPLPFVKGDDTE